MNRRHCLSIAALLLVLVCLLGPAGLSAQVLSRWVAEYRFGAEQISIVGPPGKLIYQNNLALPLSENTLFVTISTTGDAHEGNTHWFSAQVNSQFCNPGNQGAG